MNTQYFQINPVQPEKKIIKQAADLLEALEVVAFPTETVYGLGAAAFKPEAVKKIFLAKGRPASNPLLIHVSNMEQVDAIALEIPSLARELMHRFWPGPLSIILPACPEVPAIVTGGKNSVGLRMPSHPVALALIEQAGPLAAPSANLSGRPSPVTAEHVKADLDGRIAAVIDAGPTGLGLESTIIDLSAGECRILRRGGITIEELQETCGTNIEICTDQNETTPHHQTSTRVLLTEKWEELEPAIREFAEAGQKLSLLYNHMGEQFEQWEKIKQKLYGHSLHIYEMDLRDHNSQLYSILRDAEDNKVDVLIFTPLPLELSGTAASLRDRIYQAASSLIEKKK